MPGADYHTQSVLVPLTMDTPSLSGGSVSSQLGHVADHPERLWGRVNNSQLISLEGPGKGPRPAPTHDLELGVGGQTCLVQLRQEAQEDGAGVQRQLLLQELG